ncbi:MAG: hypothetical protein R3Y07_04515 [Eubacteriales bacterium]
MKKILILIGCLAGLCSCSSSSQGQYLSVTPYSVAPVGESNYIGVESYHELVTALLFLVNEERESGKIRMVQYTREGAKDDLNLAVVEVMRETALGSFSVGDMTWELNSIVGNLEADVVVEYKRSKEELDAVFPVSGFSTSVAALSTALERGERGLVLHRSYSTTDRSQIARIIASAYESSARYLVELPEIQTTFYPNEGAWKIVEFQLGYSQSEEDHATRQNLLDVQIKSLAGKIWVDPSDIVENMCAMMMEGVTISDEGDTPWDILVKKVGTPRGVAYSLLALSQEMGLSATVVEGSFWEVPHTWNSIELEDGSTVYVDLSAASENGVVYYSRAEMEQLGYGW